MRLPQSLIKALNKISKNFNTKPVARYVAFLMAALVALMVTAVAVLALRGTVAILEPKGLIALQQRDLIFFTALLSLLVIVPVYALTIFIVWKYRAVNKKTKYTPDWDGHKGIEALWWTVPCAIILVLSVVTWQTSHKLDPYQPIRSPKKPLTIQVVALEWKWLFIYPEQNIATVNYFQIPENTPINFEITSDAPMNSFWIPQLGSQIYAMPGMTTTLNLIADEPGKYNGASANISGAGFASMRFVAEAVPRADFDNWVAKA
ncbi:MAG TPA: ubiquinol oxidase subunit II, partial [Candidatus Saccharimonadales bacterium]